MNHTPIAPTMASDDDFDTGTLTKVKPTTAKPPLYKVLLMNDD